jgi:hypothetical protein
MAKDVNFKDASAALRSVRGRNLATVQLPRDSQDCRARVGPGGDVISREPPRLLVTPAGNCPPPHCPNYLRSFRLSRRDRNSLAVIKCQPSRLFRYLVYR